MQRRKVRGGAALEMALFLPWFVFLFVGAFDWGMYAHALISVESAARSACQYTSRASANKADSATACSYVIAEMKVSPNVTGTTCAALPLIVSAAGATGPDNREASQVTVTYRTPQLIPIPGLLAGQATISRSVTMRVGS
ncbi:MAG: pilus assembly protein [Acidobacteria bacterium]|nr:pilus assembly protein [Acidobacteriota bacterium]